MCLYPCLFQYAGNIPEARLWDALVFFGLFLAIGAVVYLIVLVGIGVATYLRTKSYSDYNLAGRSNNKWVTAISAESSDMSGWLLMELPGSAYLAGFSSI